jgi:hypothetical protein
MSKKRSYKWSKIKPVIGFIFEFRCYICKKQDSKNHVHHLDKNPDNNESYNLMVLCPYHHKIAHCGVNYVYTELTNEQCLMLSQLDSLYNKIG